MLTPRTTAALRPASTGSPRAVSVVLFEPLEPRALMSFTLMSGGNDLAALGVTSTDSAEVLHLEASTRIDLAAAWSGQANNNLIGVNRFRADPRFSNITGSGYTIAVIDTGINLASSYFGPDANRNGVADRIVASVDFTRSSGTGADNNGHGSNVASAIASSNSAYPGVAPGAGIAALKVASADGSMLVGDIERALQWVIRNASTFNIVGVNLSLGDPTINVNSPSTQARWGINDEFAQLASRGIIPVAAAGNAYGTFQREGVSYPAADPNVIAVGAVYGGNIGAVSYSNARANTTDADRITPFSQRSTGVNMVFAPGAPVTGAAASGSGSVTMHGTSQASPQVAGIVALSQQLAQNTLGRRLSPAEFRSLLISTGTTITDGDDENDSVANTGKQFKRVDMLAMAEAILRLAPSAGPVTPAPTPTPPAAPAPTPTPTPSPPPAPPANHVPTIRNVAPVVAIRTGTTQTITFAGLTSALGAADPDGDGFTFRILDALQAKVSKNGRVLTSDSSVGTLAAGESWQVQPLTGRTGLVGLFTAVAVDSRGGQSRPFLITGNLSTSAPVRPLSALLHGADSGDPGEVIWSVLPLASTPLRAIASITASAPGVTSAAGQDPALAFDLHALMSGRSAASLLEAFAA